MAFGMKFFNKKEAAPKSTSDSSVTEKAKDLASGATELSAKAIALAALIAAGGNAHAAEKMDKDQTPVNKIEMSSQEVNTGFISQEDMAKLTHEVDSIEHLKTQAEKAEDSYEVQINAAHGGLNSILKALPGFNQYAQVYHRAENFIRESAKNYDLKSNAGFEKFKNDMKTIVFNAEKMKQYDPKYASELVKFGKDYDATYFGFNDLKVRDAKVLNEQQLVNAVINDLYAETYIDTQDKEVASRDKKIKEANELPDNGLTASK